MPDANTEGGRMNKLQKSVGICNSDVRPYVNDSICKNRGITRLAVNITPSESSRNLLRCGATIGGSTTQERVRELLARNDTLKNSVSEGVRIAKLIQETSACSPPPAFYTPIVPLTCPPLPPPPAPPARSCPLTKNQKF